MSVKNENTAGGESVVLERPEASGVYASLFEKINLSPVSELSALDIWQDNQAMSDATADERLTAGMQVFLECLTKAGSKVEKLDRTLIDHHIAELDYQISRQLDRVMHHEAFQSVESLWRGVKSLVDKTDFRQNVKIELLDLSKDDLRQDFEDAPEIIQSGYLTCPVARLQQDLQGVWRLDESFLPPLLTVQSSRWLVTQLEQLMTQLRARLIRLMAMRRESNERMADFAVADVSLFWLLNALNSAEPVLGQFQRNLQSPPERLHTELSRLAGSLLTFSLEHQVSAIPPYQHEQLNAVFPPLFDLLSDLLEASLPSRVVSIELEHDKRLHFWQARLHDPRLREGADYYLSVRSPMPVAQLQEQFPRQCKVGSPDHVRGIVNSSRVGVPLTPLRHVPAAIPLRLENQYFSLDVSHPLATDMLDSGNCMFYVPGMLGEPELELFAVLRT